MEMALKILREVIEASFLQNFPNHNRWGFLHIEIYFGLRRNLKTDKMKICNRSAAIFVGTISVKVAPYWIIPFKNFHKIAGLPDLKFSYNSSLKIVLWSLSTLQPLRSSSESSQQMAEHCAAARQHYQKFASTANLSDCLPIMKTDKSCILIWSPNIRTFFKCEICLTLTYIKDNYFSINKEQLIPCHPLIF